MNLKFDSKIDLNKILEYICAEKIQLYSLDQIIYWINRSNIFFDGEYIMHKCDVINYKKYKLYNLNEEKLNLKISIFKIFLLTYHNYNFLRLAIEKRTNNFLDRKNK